MADPGYAQATRWTMVAVGICVVIVAAHTAWRCMRAGGWPTVPGEITRSGLEDQVVEDNEGGTRTRYKPGIRYRYTVKGRQYLGDRVSFGFEWHRFAWTAQRVADRYPAGKRVRVHVCPADPSEASLESGVTLAALGALAGGIAIIAVAFLWPVK